MNPNRLLVVDDEVEILELIARVAREAGFDVADAKNFREFRLLDRSFDPSLIVLNMHMPEVDGVVLLQYLADKSSKAQIVVLSGMAAEIVRVVKQLGSARGLNMASALRKPVMLNDLHTALADAKR